MAQQAWQRYSRLQGVLAANSNRGSNPPTGRPQHEYMNETTWYAADDEQPAARPSGSRPSGCGPDASTFEEPIDPTDARDVASADAQQTEPAAEAEADGAVATPEVGKRFILAGNAYLTLQGAERRYTYRVAQGKPREGEDPDRSQPFFLSLLTGPDNTSEYTYVGIVDQHTGKVRLTRASKYKTASPPVAAWDWVMSRLFAGQSYAPARVHHAGRCGRCGRLLTVPTSIESGFGPECAGKLG